MSSASLMAACGSTATEESAGAAHHAGGDAPGNGPAFTAKDASVSAGLVIYMVGGGGGEPVTALSLCAGQCVDLQAVSSSAGAASYVWRDPSGAQVASGVAVPVCPAASGACSVEASAAGSVGEFVTPALRASLAVTVGATCLADGGPPASADAGPIVAGEGGAPPVSRTCDVEWPQPAGVRVNGISLAPGPAGGSYVVVDWSTRDPSDPTSGGKLTFGAAAPGVSAGFAVLDLDAACNLRWVHAYPGGILRSRVASDAAFDVMVAVTFDETLTLDTGPLQAAKGVDETVVFSLDEAGRSRWTHGFHTSATGGSYGALLVGAPDGTTTLSVQANPAADFGAGGSARNATGSAGMHWYLVQLDGAGTFLTQRDEASLGPSGGQSEVTTLATDGAGALRMAARLPANPSLLAFPERLAGAAPLRSTSITPATFFGTNAQFAVVATGPSGASYAMESDPSASDVVQAFGPQGALLWQSAGGRPSNANSNAVATQITVAPGASPSAGDRIFTGGIFFGSVAVLPGAPLSTSGPPSDRDIEVQVLGSDGARLRQFQFGGPLDDELGALGVDAAGHVVIVGYTADTGWDTSRLFFLKEAL